MYSGIDYWIVSAFYFTWIHSIAKQSYILSQFLSLTAIDYLIVFRVAKFINRCVRVITLDFLPSTFSLIFSISLSFLLNTILSCPLVALFAFYPLRTVVLSRFFVLLPFSASAPRSIFLRRLRYRVFFIELLIKTRPLYRPAVNCLLLRDRRFRRITLPFHDNPPFPRRRELTSTSVTTDLPSFCLLHVSSTH